MGGGGGGGRVKTYTESYLVRLKAKSGVMSQYLMS